MNVLPFCHQTRLLLQNVECKLDSLPSLSFRNGRSIEPANPAFKYEFEFGEELKAVSVVDSIMASETVVFRNVASTCSSAQFYHKQTPSFC